MQAARDSATRRFFTGLTEYAFAARLGVADPPLVDYIAELLVRFIRSDELYPVIVSARCPNQRQHGLTPGKVIQRGQDASAGRRRLARITAIHQRHLHAVPQQTVGNARADEPAADDDYLRHGVLSDADSVAMSQLSSAVPEVTTA
jgi:hypothetical protein